MKPASGRDRAVVLGGVAAVAAALGHPTRLTLVNVLAQAEKPVDWLAAHTGESLANTSAHLRVLATAGIVSADRRGRHVFYAVRSPLVFPLISALRRASEDVAPGVRESARRLFGGVPQLDRTPQQLASDVREGRLTLVDLRPGDEYAAGHLPGAVSLPFDVLNGAAIRLPRRRPVAAYCRGPYCALGAEGVRRLRAHAFDARRVPFGVVEWRAEGRRIEGGEGARA